MNQYLDKNGLNILADQINSRAKTSDIQSSLNLINALFNPNKRVVGSGIKKFLDDSSSGNWTHTSLVTGCYMFQLYKKGHGNTVTIYVNNVAVCSSPFWGTDSSGTELEQTDISWTPQIFVKKGDVIKITSDNSSSSTVYRWFLNHYNCWGIE